MKKIIIIISIGFMLLLAGTFMMILQRSKSETLKPEVFQIKLLISVDSKILEQYYIEVDNHLQKVTSQNSQSFGEIYFLDYDKKIVYQKSEQQYLYFTFNDLNLSVNVLDIFDMLKKSQNIEEINNSIKKYGLDTDIIISKIISANNLIGTLPSLFNYYDNKTIYATDSRDNEIFAIVEYKNGKIQKIEFQVENIKFEYQISYNFDKEVQLPTV